ncbi:MAG: helix-turn-helix transcriptional regulator [Neisseriaceae bacterium]|nr:helix-turn-helix transcriptional regulator [Neisseriaceae bacterium]MBP6861501.1 helix-turn-helix transcriptional regulator [Neisseriaceae bacterium]
MTVPQFNLKPALTAYAQDYAHGEEEYPHTHDCAQLMHTLSGVVRVETHAGVWMVPPNRGLWIPARMAHSLRAIGLVRARKLFVDPLARADLPDGCGVVAISPLLKALIVAALDIEPQPPQGGREARVIELILDELRWLPVLAFHVPTPSSSALQQLCRKVSDRIADPWTLADAATMLGVSERTVSRQFQRETQMTFVAWLRNQRLQFALERLALGEGILAVALAVGYDSPSAFSAMFRSHLGQSPSEYVQHLRADSMA